MSEQQSFPADPTTIVALTLAMLGIHPDQSLVTVALGADGRVIVATRLDLTTDAVEMTGQGQHLAGMLARNAAVHALVITFAADRMAADGHRAAIEDALTEAGIKIAHSLHVDGEQIIDTVGECWALPTDEQSEAVRRRTGAEAPTSREDKIATVAPIDAPAVTQQVAWAEVTTADPADAPATLDALCGLHLATGQISDADIAQYAIQVAQVRYRDALCAALAAEDAMPNTAATLTYLAQRVPRGYRADAYTVAGLALYVASKTIEARGALDQAITANPSHTLARLVSLSLSEGVPPTAVRELVRGLTDDND